MLPKSFSYLIEFYHEKHDSTLLEEGVRLLIDCPLSASSMCLLLQQAKERALAHGLPDIAVSSLVLDDDYLLQLYSPNVIAYDLLNVTALFISSPLSGNAFYLLLRCFAASTVKRKGRLDVYLNVGCLEILQIQWLSTDFSQLCQTYCNLHPLNVGQANSLNNILDIVSFPAGGHIGSVCWGLKSASGYSVRCFLVSPNFF